MEGSAKKQGLGIFYKVRLFVCFCFEATLVEKYLKFFFLRRIPPCVWSLRDTSCLETVLSLSFPRAPSPYQITSLLPACS